MTPAAAGTRSLQKAERIKNVLPESAWIGNELREKPLGGFSRFSSEIFLRADILQAIRRERCYNEPEERGRSL